MPHFRSQGFQAGQNCRMYVLIPLLFNALLPSRDINH